jgi:hypothetical protein
MAIVLGWIVFAVIVGIAASARGRSGFGFFLLSLLLSPVIGIPSYLDKGTSNNDSFCCWRDHR